MSGPINILAVQKDLAVDPAAFHQVIHTVQSPEQCGFATAGRADECGDAMFLDLQVDVLERLEIPIVEVKVLYVKFIHIVTCSEFCLPHRR